MIGRREVLALTGAMLLHPALFSPALQAKAADETRLIRETAIAVPEPKSPLQFDLFYDLSRFITARSDLDRELAELHFEHFRQEEWGWKIAGRIYGIITDELAKGRVSAPELLAERKLSDLDQWYAQHVLDSWFEGMYRFDGREVRVTLEHALMWDVLDGILPVHGLSDADYGFWSEPPKL